MLLYTIVPEEELFPAEPDGDEQQEELVETGGVKLLVRMQAGGGIISRLISTDPRHFLDPRWQPGMRIRP